MKSGGGRNKLQLETLLADSLSHKRFLSGRWSRKYKRSDFKRTKRTLDLEVYEVNTFWNNFSFLWYFSKLICWISTKPPAVYATRLPQQLNPCHKCDGSVSYQDKLVTRKAFRSMLFYRRICCPLEGLEIEERSIFFLEKDFFCLVTSVTRQKKEESNLRPSDSPLRCYTTETLQ